MDTNICLFYKMKTLAYVQKMSIVFQIPATNSEISIITPQVQVAAHHTYKNLWIQVGLFGKPLNRSHDSYNIDR